MPILNKFAGAFPTSVIYITAGTLIAVWTLVYWGFNVPESQAGYFWLVGFLLTGLSLLAIGVLFAKFGRADRTEQTAARAPSLVSSGPSIPQTADIITPVASSDGPATLLKTD